MPDNEIVNHRPKRTDTGEMESRLASPRQPMTDITTPPLLEVPVPMPAPPPWTGSTRRAERPGVGVVPWLLGILSLVTCWPLGIPALVTTGMARTTSNRSAAAVQADELHEAARLLGRSRRYRSMSLGCIAAALALFVSLLLVTGQTVIIGT